MTTTAFAGMLSPSVAALQGFGLRPSSGIRYLSGELRTEASWPGSRAA
jgi:hypothetical protein